MANEINVTTLQLVIDIYPVRTELTPPAKQAFTSTW